MSVAGFVLFFEVERKKNQRVGEENVFVNVKIRKREEWEEKKMKVWMNAKNLSDEAKEVLV